MKVGGWVGLDAGVDPAPAEAPQPEIAITTAAHAAHIITETRPGPENGGRNWLVIGMAGGMPRSRDPASRLRPSAAVSAPEGAACDGRRGRQAGVRGNGYASR
ncbi:MAG: hypothetical protein NVSMB29_04770 [Candidatus Dormibacteria bacterium]